VLAEVCWQHLICRDTYGFETSLHDAPISLNVIDTRAILWIFKVLAVINSLVQESQWWQLPITCPFIRLDCGGRSHHFQNDGQQCGDITLIHELDVANLLLRIIHTEHPTLFLPQLSATMVLVLCLHRDGFVDLYDLSTPPSTASVRSLWFTMHSQCTEYFLWANVTKIRKPLDDGGWWNADVVRRLCYAGFRCPEIHQGQHFPGQRSMYPVTEPFFFICVMVQRHRWQTAPARIRLCSWKYFSISSSPPAVMRLDSKMSTSVETQWWMNSDLI